MYKIAVYKNNGETTIVETATFDAEAVHEAINTPSIDSVRIGDNTYKTHMIQSVEVLQKP